MILKKIVGGMWLKAVDVKDQDVIEFASGVSEEESQFKNKNGTAQIQKVIMVKIPDGKILKLGLKSQAINNMIDEYGADADQWQGKKARVWIREYQGKDGQWKDGVYITALNKNLKGEVIDGSMPIIDLSEKEEVDLKDIPF